MRRTALLSAFLAPSLALGLCASDVRADDVGDSIRVRLYSVSPTQYIFRGILQTDKGLIGQAGSELRTALVDEESFKLVVPVGVWGSLHPGDKSDVPNVPAAWYESRMQGGLGAIVGGLEGDLQFIAYSSPNGSFNDIYELDLNARFRDDTIWAADDEDAIFRGVFPYLVLARELSGARDGGDSGTYAEIGATPTVRLLYSSFLGVDFGLPLSMGMSLGDYYEVPDATTGKRSDEFLGFVSAGGVLDIAARFVPERLGLWNVRGHLDVVFPTAFDSDTSNRVDTAELVASMETVLSF